MKTFTKNETFKLKNKGLETQKNKKVLVAFFIEVILIVFCLTKNRY